jgi:hypothetical protein
VWDDGCLVLTPAKVCYTIRQIAVLIEQQQEEETCTKTPSS